MHIARAWWSHDTKWPPIKTNKQTNISWPADFLRDQINWQTQNLCDITDNSISFQKRHKHDQTIVSSFCVNAEIRWVYRLALRAECKCVRCNDLNKEWKFTNIAWFAFSLWTVWLCVYIYYPLIPNWKAPGLVTEVERSNCPQHHDDHRRTD